MEATTNPNGRESLVSISETLRQMTRGSRIEKNEREPLTPDEIFKKCQERAEKYNASTGSLTDYDCKKCLNRGNFQYAERNERNGMIYERLYPCECMKIRRSIRRAKASGLYDSFRLYRFDNFKVSEPWQQDMIEKAKAYADCGAESWFYIGGAVGCGKTHICTAIVRSLIYSGKMVYYEPWLTLTAKLKATQYSDQDTYYRELSRVQTVDVLYIDDFFKPTQADRSRPSGADIAVAYEILNYRYVNRLPTMISSEHLIDKLMEFDEATGSRVYQMAKGYTLNIKGGKGKNYRVKDD